MTALRYSAIAMLAAGLLFLTAWNLHAQGSVDLSGTRIEIGPSDAPGAVAEVTMHNQTKNGPRDNSTHTLTFGDVSVDVTFTWNPDGSDDRMTVETGPDYIAVPPSLDVQERFSGKIVIYPLRAVGM